MISKPCARADRGCTGVVWGRGPKTLAAHDYCSRRCATRGRFEDGWRPHVITKDEQSKGGKQGGRIGGQLRRKRAVQQHAARLVTLVPKGLSERMDDEVRVAVLALLVRAWRHGHKTGRAMRNRRQERARQRRAEHGASRRILSQLAKGRAA